MTRHGRSNSRASERRGIVGETLPALKGLILTARQTERVHWLVFVFTRQPSTDSVAQ